ncbi:MAG: hypothetical protein O2821_11330 [Chloroflexi bacterium]|nr:hypothetical protein [Chloroflexota bacterium]MDA1228062.1 hypothetical protein [Chloroflexota bacterium]
MAKVETKEWPEWNRRRDPELWDFYAEQLLEPGWAGELTESEFDYLESKLKRYKRLRNKWGFQSEDDILSPEAIQTVAMSGDPEDSSFNAGLVRGMEIEDESHNIEESAEAS